MVVYKYYNAISSIKRGSTSLRLTAFKLICIDTLCDIRCYVKDPRGK